MSETQETVWIVQRLEFVGIVGGRGVNKSVPVKAFDDREDARTFRDKQEERSRSGTRYRVTGVKKG